MREYVYKLEKKDYLDWIKYEADQIDNPSVRRKYFLAVISVIGCVLLLEVIFIGWGQIAYLSCVAGFMLVLGMIGIFSPKNRIRTLYVQAGLDKVEKKKMFPTITMKLDSAVFSLESDKSNEKEVYPYRQIKEIIPCENIIMLKMEDGKMQFVSRSAFPNQSGCLKFQQYLEDKMDEK